MKRFIDSDGTFEIKIPITWRYSLADGKVHTFQEYEIWKSDAFQLSIRKVKDEGEKNNFLNIIKSLAVSKISDMEYYSFPDREDEEFTTKTWVRLFEDKVVLFSLTYQSNPDKDLDNSFLQEKVQTVYSIITEFKLIDKKESTAKISSYRFDMFLQGIGATAVFLNKAVENKAFIEATCVLANQIDALLRTGIILKKQIINGNREIEIEWIYQGLDDKKKSEKDIYIKALELGIINQSIVDKLYEVYDDRNRVVHRFIISEITLAEVEEIAYKYYKMQKIINKIIYDLESEQINLGVGMTTNNGGKIEVNSYSEYIKGKIGKLNYFDEKYKEK